MRLCCKDLVEDLRNPVIYFDSMKVVILFSMHIESRRCAFLAHEATIQGAGQESMLNDATALLIYRAAVLAAAGSFSLVADAPILVLAAVGGLVAGYVLARLSVVSKRVCARPGQQHRSAIRWHLWGVAAVRAPGLSPIITVVIYAMTLAQAAPGRLGARLAPIRCGRLRSSS